MTAAAAALVRTGRDLAVACAEEQRWEFLLTVAPLRIVGGTGSPVDPLAIF